MPLTIDAITLPEDLQWVDEYEWDGVGQSVSRSVTGALLVQEQSKLHGRTITLVGGPDGGWVTRAMVDSLKAKADASPAMALTMPDGRTFNVRFNRQDGPPIEAQQVMRFAYPDDDSWYTLTLRFLTVE